MGNKTKDELAAEALTEKWFKENNWVPTEGKVIPAIAMFHAGLAHEREKSKRLVTDIKDTVEYLEKTDKPLTLVEISILNTFKQSLRSYTAGGEGE